jgi:2,3-bisphosphoglycerate-independent phosphoglycerate mutase
MRPVVLVVLDGWGIRKKKDGNATLLADTPNLKRLLQRYPSTTVNTSGLSVGLPKGQMGNSEVGHLTLGSGRIIYQELTRINKTIADGSFYENPTLNGVIMNVKERGAALHLMGLLSDGGVHSHITHLYALLDVAKKRGLNKVYIHAFLDGRDTPPTSGRGYIEGLLANIKKIGVGRIATISGRYFAMDRDRRWERVRRAYDALVEGEGVKAEDPTKAVERAYEKKETDEFIQPIVIMSYGKPTATVWNDDSIIFFNFRGDRARELTTAFITTDFAGFDRKKRPRLATFLCMTEYDREFELPVLFQPQELKNILGEVLSRNGVEQFRVSETEKYAHVTFFFNGGMEKPLPGEERFLIPSVKHVPTYDKFPSMRAPEIADAAVEKIKEGRHRFILMNFANGDMVGHTGDLHAAIKACEEVDRGVGRVVDAALDKGWAVLVTSDHGNCEQMIDEVTGEPYTAHTSRKVPFILVDDERSAITLREGAGLADVAPTLLKIMALEVPPDMDGEPLF